MKILMPLTFLLFASLWDSNTFDTNIQEFPELTEITVTQELRPVEKIINPKDLDCLATNIYFEARGEPVQGMIAVAHVTLNRVKSKSFPNDVCSVVYQAKTHSNGIPIRHKCQFSWYCDGKREVIEEEDKYNEIKELARQILSEENEDITDGAEFYHTLDVSPFWKNAFKQTVVINEHVFYKKG